MTPTIADHEQLRRELAEMRVLYWTANGLRAQMELALGEWARTYATGQHVVHWNGNFRDHCPGCVAEFRLLELADKVARAPVAGTDPQHGRGQASPTDTAAHALDPVQVVP
jgi:hypothetical protein